MKSEHRFVYAPGGVPVIGVVHTAENSSDLGVVIVVGGPQYRVGSHRFFVQLARSLAGSGFETFRFDFTGMGDSHGIRRSFDNVDGELASAIDEFQRRRPHVRRFALVGLCDGATAAMLYAPKDRRVCGLAMLNPWVNSPAAAAQVRIVSYYLRRIVSGDFWRKLLRGNVEVASSIGELAQAGKDAIGAGQAEQDGFLSRFERNLSRYSGLMLIVLSGQDFTADEFRLWSRGSPERQSLIRSSRVQLYEQPLANHTFSAPSQKREVVARIVQFCSETSAGGASACSS